MTTFNTAFNWDSTGPPVISTLDENDFMQLLQRQFPSLGSSTSTLPPSNTASKKPVVVQTANPQSLNKFQSPNSISPLSTDSSPSPPSGHEDSHLPTGSATGSDPNNSKKGVSGDIEEHHKRKVSADDFEDEIGQPSAKNQHTDESGRNSLIRRKSNGGEKGPDETRLLKRKEQNRAAQRAFRERKEKHVKDLEDKVAQLEAKTESQAAENENLRDMLSRLQSENTMLKQASFTFSVPSSSSSGPSNVTSRTTRSLPGPVSMFGTGADAGPSRSSALSMSSSSSSPSKDPQPTLFDQFDSSFSPLAASTPASVGGASSSASINVNSTLSAADLDTMALFGSTGPFTTISSNPMFTSYRDPIQSMNAFASFGGWDADITMNNNNDNNNNVNSTVVTGSTAGSTGLDDLFGDQFPGLIRLSQDFLTAGDGGGASPPPAAPSRTGGDNHTACPKTKEDIKRMIAHGPKGTFGGSSLPQVPHRPDTDSPGSTQLNGGNPYDSAFHEALGNGAAKPAGVCDNYSIDELCLEMQRKATCSMGQHC